MKRLLLALPLACLFALPATAATTKVTAKKPAVHAKTPAKVKHKPPVTAPADEYFGHQKYSILGIRNALHDLSIRYDGTAGHVPFLYSNGAGLEDAMHDWDHKYHGDLWLAHYLFQLDQIYMRMPPDVGREKVDSLSHWIIGDYPNTFYSRYLIKIEKVRQAKLAASTPTPTPAATASPTAVATTGPSYSQDISQPVPAKPSAAPSLAPELRVDRP